MASDPKAKATPAPKKEAPAAKKEAVAAEKSTPDATAKTAASKPTHPKTEGGETAAAAPKNYSRGEGQKPVTQAYKDNWNAIFARSEEEDQEEKAIVQFPPSRTLTPSPAAAGGSPCRWWSSASRR